MIYYMLVCICVHMCVYVYIYIYTWIRTPHPKLRDPSASGPARKRATACRFCGAERKRSAGQGLGSLHFFWAAPSI